MSRINTDDPKFFDWWRDQYDTFTVEENIEIGDQLERKYPGQASFNPAVFDQFFQRRRIKSLSVLEIGGWKGELALHCFTRHHPAISDWLNIDMCKAAVDKSIQMPYPYRSYFPHDFKWWRNISKHNIIQPRSYDVCISAHTIEHLSNVDLMEVIGSITGIPSIIFEAPISMEGQKWDGYFGTHILEMGWNDINRLMVEQKYKVEKINDWAFEYTLETK